MQSKICRIKQLASDGSKQGILPVSSATIWRWVRENRFPKPIRLGPGVTGWYINDIEAFIEKCNEGAKS
jgi:predicted DNA-binding transcriptional regulator AlpA